MQFQFYFQLKHEHVKTLFWLLFLVIMLIYNSVGIAQKKRELQREDSNKFKRTTEEKNNQELAPLD